MAVVRGIHRAGAVINTIAEVVMVIMLGAMVIITGAQIVCRMFFTSLTWSEEATRYLLIWSTFFGAGCVYRSGGHIAITALVDHLPEKIRKAMQILVHLLCLVLFVLLIYYGIRYYAKQGSQLSAALRIPMRYVYTCIPIGSAILALHAVDAILQLLTEKKEEK